MTKREKVRRARIRMIKKMIKEAKRNMGYSDECPMEYRKNSKNAFVNSFNMIILCAFSIAFFSFMFLFLG